MGRPTLIIFAKSPRMGVSKTRLASGIGVVRAWRVKRTLDSHTCQVARSPRWNTLLAVAPARDETALFPGTWPQDIKRIGQGKGDLGARMAGALRRYSSGPVCIIGSDLPDLTRRDVADAFGALRHYDVVLGPATDGGYWLIGMRGACARWARLAGIRWSSPHTLGDTLSALPRHWRVGFLRELEDVDDAVSFQRRKRVSR
jgi:uncharacterized protein